MFSYFLSDDRYISQYKVYSLMCFRHIYELFLCAYYVMFIFGDGAEDVIHLKNRTLLFFMVLSIVG